MTEPTLIFTDGHRISDKKDSDAEDAREERARKIEAVIASLNALTAEVVKDAEEVPIEATAKVASATPEKEKVDLDDLYVRAYTNPNPWETGELGCSREHAELEIEEPTEPPVYQAVAQNAQRFNTGKPELHYLLTFPEAMRGIARVTTYGSKKYALYNYTKGAPASESVSCALRHLLAWFSGEDTDPESGLCHLDAFVWNAARLTHEMATRPDLDNRPHVLMKQPSEPDKT